MKSTTKNRNKKTGTEPKATPVDKKHQAEKFPGYPPYNPNDDIMNQSDRIDADIEDTETANNSLITATQKPGKVTSKKDNLSTIDTPEEEAEIAKDQFAVTSEDLEALGPEDLSLDMGEDEELKHRTTPVDFSGKDLDVPGSELDDKTEETGAEDEENNSYSIGGDDHNDLEESKGE